MVKHHHHNLPSVRAGKRNGLEAVEPVLFISSRKFRAKREHCASCCSLLFRDDSRAMELEACLFRWCDMQGTYNLSAEKIFLFRCPTALKR